MTTRMTAQRLGRLIAAGDVAAAKAAIADQPNLLGRTVERDGQGGWTPLHVAVAENQPEIVELLVEAGAELTARTDHGRTPLHIALQFAPDLVDRLREHGAPLDAPAAAYVDDVDRLAAELDGGTPLVEKVTGIQLLAWAARGGAVRCARLLLERGADVNGGALHSAARGGRLELVRVLLERGADVDRRDPATGRTPLHSAIAAGPDGDAPEVVRVLLAAGADVNATTSDGASALDMSRIAAARARRRDAGRATGHDALAELLVAHGATG
jgi:ankyrin repeat protein